MPPKTPEGKRLGPNGLLRFRHHLRGDLKVGEILLGRIPVPLHRRDIGRAAPQLQAQIDDCWPIATDFVRAGVATM